MKLDKTDSFLDLYRFLPYIFFALFIILLGLVLVVYASYLYAFFIAGILFILFRTPHKWLLIQFGARRNVTAAVSTLIIILILIIPSIYLLISLLHEVAIAVQWAKNWFTVENMTRLYHENQWIDQYVKLTEADLQKFREQLSEFSREAGFLTLKQGGQWLLSSIKFIVDFTFAIFILFFLLKSVDRIGYIVYKNLPFPDRFEKHIGDRMVQIFEAVVKGNLFISFLQGFIIGVAFWLCGLPTPVLYGALAAFFALIPVIGTAIVWFPGALFLYLNGHPSMALALGGLSLFFYFFLENLIKPLLLDKELHLHPLFLFLAIVGGLNAFGVKGLILGPFIVTMFVTIWELVSEWNRKFSEIDHEQTKD